MMWLLASDLAILIDTFEISSLAIRDSLVAAEKTKETTE